MKKIQLIRDYKHPILFYVLATIIPWSFWIIAGYISHLNSPNVKLVTILGFIGLLSPMVIAFWLIHKNTSLKKDLFGRFVNFKSIKPIYLFLTIFLMLGTILLAQTISLLFGYSPT